MAVKVYVVFYSMYGHIYTMAEAEAEGAREVKGVDVKLLQVPETLSDEGALAGTKIGGYHLLKRIGMGGMGEVYKAIQISRWRRPSSLPRRTPSSSARRPVSATCARRCAASSTRPEGCG